MVLCSLMASNMLAPCATSRVLASQPLPGRHAAPVVAMEAGAAEARSPDLRPAQARPDQRRLRGIEIGRPGAPADRLCRVMAAGGRVRRVQEICGVVETHARGPTRGAPGDNV